jgi:hypothetical protein
VQIRVHINDTLLIKRKMVSYFFIKFIVYKFVVALNVYNCIGDTRRLQQLKKQTVRYFRGIFKSNHHRQIRKKHVQFFLFV